MRPHRACIGAVERTDQSLLAARGLEQSMCGARRQKFSLFSQNLMRARDTVAWWSGYLSFPASLFRSSEEGWRALVI